MVRDFNVAAGFRGDINGLRAWAVVAVVLYHFGMPGLSGGFVGVDVFFVISGFLMTGIVVRGLEREGAGFSLLAFYMARARRILPALIVLCAVLMALGWWVLQPLDYKALGTHSVFSLAFLSNIKFWREAGYFDVASHEKWLLHTWSLAVEWQFYLLLPLVLLAVWTWRPGRRPVIAVMTVGLLASLALSVVATPLRPAAAFYLLPTRAWEMLAGGMVYLLLHRWPMTVRQCKVLEAAGLVLVVGAVVGFDASSPWPGWRALVPVIGAVCVLLAARSGSRWTGHPVAQWLGTRSYSIYLWHWPIMVALTYLGWQADSKAMASGLLLTLVLGDLSYRLVESPARVHLGRLRLGLGAGVLLGGSVVVAASAGGVLLKDGVLGRLSPTIEVLGKEGLNKNPRQDDCFLQTGIESPSCTFGGNLVRAILIGDSHADAVVSALVASMPSMSVGVKLWGYSGCPTIYGVKYLSSEFGALRKCEDFMNWVARELASTPTDIPVLIVNRTSIYAKGFNEIGSQNPGDSIVYFDESRRFSDLVEFAKRLTDTACELADKRPVYLVRPIPEMGLDVPKTMARRVAMGQDRAISVSLAEYHQRHAFVWAAQDAARDRCGVKILDPLPYLCSDGRCQGSRDGRPLYYDDDHLSEYGNKLLVPMFAEVFQAH